MNKPSKTVFTSKGSYILLINGDTENIIVIKKPKKKKRWDIIKEIKKTIEMQKLRALAEIVINAMIIIMSSMRTEQILDWRLIKKMMQFSI